MRVTTQSLVDIKPQLADFLNNLEVGDTVRGKIMELLGESISLRTASGQMFTAALMTDAELKPGQIIELVISNITEDGVFAELKPDGKEPVKLSEDKMLQQVLRQMDIKPEKENVQAAKLLIKYNMPITKENVQHLVNTQKSVETMAKADVVKALTLMQSEQDINNTEFTMLAKKAAVQEPQGKQVLKALQPELEPEFIKTLESIKGEPQKSLQGSQMKLAEPKEEQPIKAAVQPEVSQISIEKRPMEENVPKQTLKQVVELLDTEEMQKAAPKVEKLIDTVVKLLETAAKAKPEHSAYLISKDIEVTPAAIKALTDNVANQGKLGTQIKELEKLIDVLERNKVDVKELRHDVKKLFIKPEALQGKEQIQEMLKDVIKTAAKLESLLKAHGLEDRADRSVLSDIKMNLDFQQSINNNITYLQIPLQVNENKTTADLYVFTGKRKGKAINPENASILIALDLMNLGHLESLISISKRNVNITFKVEKEQFKSVIMESTEGLKQSLEARGYSLNSIQVMEAFERFNLMDLEEVTNASPSSMHLDIRV